VLTSEPMSHLLFKIVSGWATQEGQKPDYPNPGNIRDCPWFPINMKAQPWAPGVPRRIYPDGSEVEMVERFRTIEDGTNPGRMIKQNIGWFWMPRSRAEGVAAMYHLLALHVAEGDSLATFIKHIAPAADSNQPDVYIANVAKWAGIADSTAQMQELLEPLVDARGFLQFLT
jgi:hypothetical protein